MPSPVEDAFNRALSTIKVSVGPGDGYGTLAALGIVCPCGHVTRCEITGEMITCNGCDEPRWIRFTREEQA